jgi:hypothetical protein
MSVQRSEVVTVIVDGEHYQYIANALELARRYIVHKRGGAHSVGRVDEFSPEEMQHTEAAMQEFWGV